ncbi:MAG: hypothetical protein NTY45_08375 [Elusimicrobia bacterium]|nr:hypothetical protein [Elusimicrobiota bacterium]
MDFIIGDGSIEILKNFFKSGSLFGSGNFTIRIMSHNRQQSRPLGDTGVRFFKEYPELLFLVTSGVIASKR